MPHIKELEELENTIVEIDALNGVYRELWKRAEKQNRILKIIIALLSIPNVALLILLIVRGMA